MSIDGTPGDDFLPGTERDDVINGFAGDDHLVGIEGNDTLNGGEGQDTLRGSAGDDVLNGGEGQDRLQGNAGDDVLNGDAGHDNLRGGDDNDTLNGGADDDYLRGGEGDDLIIGGDGFDRATFTVLTNNPSEGETGVQVGATVDLNIQGVAQNTGHGMDTLIGIEHVSGTAYNDVLIGNDGDNWIWGEGGDDILKGHGGNDLIVADEGNSTLDGGDGIDTASFLGLSDSYPSGVTVSLALQGAAQAVAAGSSMTLDDFENLSGTRQNDELIGDDGDNILAGNVGDDNLLGGEGNDTLLGDGKIEPDMHGTGGSGPITTTADVSGDFDPATTSFNDTLDGGAGNDILNGGGGTDTASFASAKEAVRVNLGVNGNGSALQVLSGEEDDLLSIENISGSAFNDFITGNNEDNVLNGGAGGDALFGKGGNDTLIGGAGDDFLRGSEGTDVLDGGDGFDRVSSFVVNPTAGIHFDLNIQGVAQDTGQGMDVLIGIEHASGTVLDDTLIGNGGSNWLWDGSDGLPGGGSGNDNIDGGAGDDVIETGGGDDVLNGGTGVDTLNFIGGHREINTDGVTYSLALQGVAQATEQGSMTTSGFENVSGSLYDDVLSGDAANNIVAGDLGSDNLSGGDGNDTLYGDGRIWQDGSDSAGGSGPIALFGQQADEAGVDEGDPDFTSGNDVLNGGRGNDDLFGGRGNDTMTGGLNADRFIIEAGSGDDVILDFRGDKIVFDASSGVDSFSDLTLTLAPGGNTLITWGTEDSILVKGLKPGQFGASDFQFASASRASAGDHGARLGQGLSDDHAHDSGFHDAMWMAIGHNSIV